MEFLPFAHGPRDIINRASLHSTERGIDPRGAKLLVKNMLIKVPVSYKNHKLKYVLVSLAVITIQKAQRRSFRNITRSTSVSLLSVLMLGLQIQFDCITNIVYFISFSVGQERNWNDYKHAIL